MNTTERQIIAIPYDSPAIKENLKDKRALIVGGTQGIGAAFGEELAKNGAVVHFSGRNDKNNLLNQLNELNSNKNEFIKADCSTVSETRNFIKNYLNSNKNKQLDYLILSLGTMANSTRTVNSEGIEIDWAISTISRQVILNEIVPSLREQKGPSKIFVLGFPGADNKFNFQDPQGEKKYDPMQVHMNTVVANEAIVHVLEAKERELRKEGLSQVSIFGLNPGLIQTGIRQRVLGSDLKGRLLEDFVGIFAGSMKSYINKTIPIIANPKIGATESGSLYNCYGESVKANSLIKGDEWKQIYDYTQSVIDQVDTKSKPEIV